MEVRMAWFSNKVQRRLRAAGLLIVLVCIPFLVRWIYFRALNRDAVVIATGPRGGQWYALAHDLRRTIEAEGEIRVGLYQDATGGALDHLQLLQAGKVDFALYLRGARQLQPDNGPPADPRQWTVVANLYSDLTLFLVRRDLYEQSKLQTPADLRRGDRQHPFRVAVGRQGTGERGIAEAILGYYFDGERSFLETKAWSYAEVAEGFRGGELDAAFITAGHQAPVFRELLEGEGVCAIGRIPEVDAIVMRNVGLTRAEVPVGLFRHGGEPIPQRPLATVASQTMLLARRDVPQWTVGAVTRTLLSEPFVYRNQLQQLSREGSDFARSHPEFPIHPGALGVYDPRLKPLIDPDFMEGIENLRSFAVSLLIAAFLAYQWYRRAVERHMDHRLDEYFAELLRIDRVTQGKMVGADEDADRLQHTLERVIRLRNDALSEFSAKDFDEDSAADSFLELCESVAAGIRSELLRWQLQRAMAQLAERADGDR